MLNLLLLSIIFTLLYIKYIHTFYLHKVAVTFVAKKTSILFFKNSNLKKMSSAGFEPASPKKEVQRANHCAMQLRSHPARKVTRAASYSRVCSVSSAEPPISHLNSSAGEVDARTLIDQIKVLTQKNQQMEDRLL